MKRIAILLMICLISLSGFKGKDPTVYKMHQVGGLHFISVEINDRSADLLVDTGCYRSILDISQYKHYKFEYRISSRKVGGIGGNTNSYYLREYKVTYKDDPIMTNFRGADMSNIHRNFREAGIDFAGILGSDFFESRKVLIDYRSNELIVRR